MCMSCRNDFMELLADGTYLAANWIRCVSKEHADKDKRIPQQSAAAPSLSNHRLQRKDFQDVLLNCSRGMSGQQSGCVNLKTG